MSDRRSIDIEGFSHGQPIPSASRIGPLVMTGGVFGVDRANGEIPEELEAQTRLMFDNLQRVLAAAGAGWGDVIRMTMYVRDRSARDAINAAWVTAFPDPASRPARHTVVSATLPAGMLVQCDAVAFIAS